jgi:hypothetical protein
MPARQASPPARPTLTEAVRSAERGPHWQGVPLHRDAEQEVASGAAMRVAPNARPEAAPAWATGVSAAGPKPTRQGELEAGDAFPEEGKPAGGSTSMIAPSVSLCHVRREDPAVGAFSLAAQDAAIVEGAGGVGGTIVVAAFVLATARHHYRDAEAAAPPSRPLAPLLPAGYRRAPANPPGAGYRESLSRRLAAHMPDLAAAIDHQIP